jgi:3-oxoacyl-[acyl-carrier-protein] synthase-3
MAVRIDAVYCTRPRHAASDSRSLAAASAEMCLERGSGHGSVPLIVYAGVYRDGNVVEPAQAPYAQRHLAEKQGVAGNGFSFDVDQLMSGIEIADGMIRSQGLDRAMVLAADSAVSFVEGPRVQAAAGALLLAPCGGGEGFTAFRTDVFPEHRGLHDGCLVWTGAKDGDPRHEMVLAQSPGYLQACVLDACESVQAFCADVDLVLGGDTLVLPSQAPLGFPGALREALGLSEEAVVDVRDELGPSLTAGPLLALEQAVQDGRFERASRVVFVTVSPGIIVSVAMYQR